MSTRDFFFSRRDWPEEVFQEYCHYIKDNRLVPYFKGLKAQKNGNAKHTSLLNALEAWQLQTGQASVDSSVPRLFKTLRAMASERQARESRLSVRQGLRELSYVDLIQEFYPDVFDSLNPDRIFSRELNLYLELATDCLNQFKTLKKRMDALDFADLETYGHGLLTRLYQSNEKEMRKRFQRRFRYIMVDEFQDTNRVQWEIIRLLCSEKGRHEKNNLQPGKLFVVGDKRQAIYRFRGGDVTVFEGVTREIKSSNSDNPQAMFWMDKEIKRRLDLISGNSSQWCTTGD